MFVFLVRLCPVVVSCLPSFCNEASHTVALGVMVLAFIIVCVHQTFQTAFKSLERQMMCGHVLENKEEDCP